MGKKKAPSARRSESSKEHEKASELITARIEALGDWRGEKLTIVRALIHEAVPSIVEEWKWHTPVWSSHGIVCTGEIYKGTVKLTFAKGASLEDPHHLFNAGWGGNVRRAIDLRAHDEIDRASFRKLIREAVALNQDTPSRRRRSSGETAGGNHPTAGPTRKSGRLAPGARPRKAEAVAKDVVLLSGRNPQIAKGDGGLR
ncbi:hypothetical protein BH23ACI1_BH23ACI1_16510 [soil metagenome]